LCCGTRPFDVATTAKLLETHANALQLFLQSFIPSDVEEIREISAFASVIIFARARAMIACVIHPYFMRMDE
jgi:hypothetical protein